jgi:hypothetical protein
MHNAWKWVGSVGVLLVGIAMIVSAFGFEKKHASPIVSGGPDINFRNFPMTSNHRYCRVGVDGAELWRRHSKVAGESSFPTKTIYRVPKETLVAAPTLAGWSYGEGSKERRLAYVHVNAGAGFDEWIMDLGELQCAEAPPAPKGMRSLDGLGGTGPGNGKSNNNERP